MQLTNHSSASNQDAGELAAIVMANGEADKLAQKLASPHKALLDIEGLTMVERVVAAVQAAPEISTVVVACRQDGAVARHLRGRVQLAEADKPTFLGGIEAGFAAVPQARRALLVTCDMPLLSADSVSALAKEAADLPDKDLVYAMVDIALTRKCYPETHRTSIHLKEGNFTAAGLSVVSRRFIEECGPHLMAAFGARKSKLAMARIFGATFLARFVLGMLSVADLVKRADELLQCNCAAVQLPFAECGFDVDSEADLAAARKSYCRLNASG